MKPIVFTLPFRLVNASNAREFHLVRAKRAASERGVTKMAVKSRLGKASAERWTVTLTRLYKARPFDDDGAVSCQKAVRDGVADALGIDDRSDRVTWQYGQRKAPSYGVEIRLEAG